MPDEPFDEPFKPAYHPLSDDLETEIDDFERRAMEAAQTGKQSAELRYTFRNLKTGEEWARFDVYGPGRSYGTAMPKEEAVRFVRITNSAHQILDTLLQAYVHADAKTAIAYVRKLFKEIRSARKLGRPKLPDGETKEEQVTQYLETHDLDATMKQFPELKAATILQYQANVYRKRSI